MTDPLKIPACTPESEFYYFMSMKTDQSCKALGDGVGLLAIVDCYSGKLELSFGVFSTAFI